MPNNPRGFGMKPKQEAPTFIETAALHIAAAIIATRGSDTTVAARMGLDGAIALCEVLDKYRKDQEKQ